jgi:hypothetical protein
VAVLLTLQALARRLTIIALLRKPGSLQGHRDVSGSALGFEYSHLEPGTGDVY